MRKDGGEDDSNNQSFSGYGLGLASLRVDNGTLVLAR